jgi:hypothetical protein
MGTWLMIGLFVDGWAHNNLGEALETSFTPWNAVFYSGFAAAVPVALGLCYFAAGRIVFGQSSGR